MRRDAAIRDRRRDPTPRQREALAAYVAAGGCVHDAAMALGIRPSTLKHHLADLRVRFGLATVQLAYPGRAAGWLSVPALEPPVSIGPTDSAPNLGQ